MEQGRNGDLRADLIVGNDHLFGLSSVEAANRIVALTVAREHLEFRLRQAQDALIAANQGTEDLRVSAADYIMRLMQQAVQASAEQSEQIRVLEGQNRVLDQALCSMFDLGVNTGRNLGERSVFNRLAELRKLRDERATPVWQRWTEEHIVTPVDRVRLATVNRVGDWVSSVSSWFGRFSTKA